MAEYIIGQEERRAYRINVANLAAAKRAAKRMADELAGPLIVTDAAGREIAHCEWLHYTQPPRWSAWK